MRRSMAGPVRVAMTAAASFGLVLAVGTPAQASKSWYYDHFSADGGTYLGSGDFHADPAGGSPDDALRACDKYAPDGWEYEIRMDHDLDGDTDWNVSTRLVSTSCTGWRATNLPEERKVRLSVYRVKSGTQDLLHSGYAVS